MEDQARRNSRVALSLVVFFSLLTLLAVAGFLYPWRLAVATEEGGGIDLTITYLLVVTGLIAVAGHVVLIWFVWKSSHGADVAYGRPSRRAEWMWGIIPVILMTALSEAGVLVVSGPVWDSLYAKEHADPVEVHVAGKQFEWYVHYPGADGTFGTPNPKLIDEQFNLMGLGDEDRDAQDDIIKRDVLYLPVNRPVVIRLRSYDVLHSFFVPHFRVKQDLIPGFQSKIQFTPTRVGKYELACAELCGMSHFEMSGEVHVVTAEEFEQWQAKQPKFGE